MSNDTSISNTMAPTRPLGDSSNAVATTAFVATAIANALPGTNLRQVVTSNYMPSAFAAFDFSQLRKLHVAMDNITGLQAVTPAWYVTAQQHETPMGHNITFKHIIEYPIGTYTNIFYNRLGKPTLPDGLTYISDLLPITIPRGAVFFEWVFGYNSLPATAQGTTADYSALTYPGGEGAANQAQPFTIDYPTQFPPGGRDRIYGAAICLVTRTNIESVWGIGDSRLFGASNNPDLLANRGAIMTGLSSIAYANHGVSSDTLEGWLSGPRRKGLKQYFTRVMLQYGINTFGQLGGSIPGYIAGHLRAQAFLAGLPVVQIAMEPEGSGVDQNTLDANSWTRTQVNQVPYMEVGRAIMNHPPLDSGIWSITPVYSDDNLHMNPLGEAQTLSYGGIQPNIMLSAPVCHTIFDPNWTPSTIDTPVFAGGYLTSGIVSAYGILQNIQPFRFEITVNWHTAGIATAVIFGFNASATTYFALTITPAGRLGVIAQGLSIVAASGTVISSGTDHFIAITCDDSGLTLYVDGASVATGAGSLGKFQTPVAAFAIGGLGQEDVTAPVSNPGWSISIKEFSSWSTASYNGPPIQPYTGSETNLVSLAHLADLNIIMGPDQVILPVAGPDPNASVTPIFQVLGPANVIEGNSAVYTVNRFGFTGSACTVNYAVQDTTAYPNDFTTTGGTCTITIASPAVVTLAAHGFTAGTNVQFTTTGALPNGIIAGQNYYVIATALATNTFEFSATPGGSAVNSSGSQSGTHTVTAFPHATLSFGTTDLVKTVSIPIQNAGAYRNPRQYNIAISNPSDSGTLDLDNVVTTITDTLAPPVGNAHYSVAIPAPIYPGPSPGTANQNWVITRSVNTSGSETVLFRTDPGPPQSATFLNFNVGAFPTGSVTFAPGDLTKTAVVVLQGFASGGPDKHYAFTIYGNSAGGINTNPTNVGTILGS